jgi:hypothetical protein
MGGEGVSDPIIAEALLVLCLLNGSEKAEGRLSRRSQARPGGPSKKRAKMRKSARKKRKKGKRK